MTQRKEKQCNIKNVALYLLKFIFILCLHFVLVVCTPAPQSSVARQKLQKIAKKVSRLIEKSRKFVFLLFNQCINFSKKLPN